MSAAWEWERLTHLVALFVATGYVKNGAPESVLLIGDPGVGKSAMLSRFEHLPTVVRLSDVTSDGLRHHVFPEMRRHGKRHIIFPEIHKLYQRRAATSENTIGLLTAAMSGEMHTQYIGREKIEDMQDFRIGLIAGMPTRIFNEWRSGLMNTGMLDRMHLVPVDFKPETRAAIESAIVSDNASMRSPVHWTHLKSAVEVKITSDSFGSIQRIVSDIQESGDRNRLIARVKSLLRASAALYGDTVVRDRDLDYFRHFVPLLRGD